MKTNAQLSCPSCLEDVSPRELLTSASGEVMCLRCWAVELDKITDPPTDGRCHGCDRVVGLAPSKWDLAESKATRRPPLCRRCSRRRANGKSLKPRHAKRSQTKKKSNKIDDNIRNLAQRKPDGPVVKFPLNNVCSACGRRKSSDPRDWDIVGAMENNEEALCKQCADL